MTDTIMKVSYDVQCIQNELLKKTTNVLPISAQGEHGKSAWTLSMS